jgi:hypothetical protein
VLASLFRLEKAINFPVPPTSIQVPVEQNCVGWDENVSWQNQSPNPDLTNSEPGEQVFFVKGESIGLSLLEKEENAGNKVFQYALQQAGNPVPTILGFQRGTGRAKLSQYAALSAYQPYQNFAIAGQGPLGERTFYMDAGRTGVANANQTTLYITVLGEVTTDDLVNAPQLSLISASGGAWLPQGNPAAGACYRIRDV